MHCKAQGVIGCSYFYYDRLKETEHFKIVMSHGMYRKNPLGVLQEHLSNTVKMQQKDASNL